MARRELKLKNDETVFIDTDISLRQMKEFKKSGLISKRFLNDLIEAEKDPSKMNFDDFDNAIYMAYLNANPVSHIDQDAFEDLISYSIELAGELYGEIVSGATKKDMLVQDFKKATNQGSKSKKKHQK